MVDSEFTLPSFLAVPDAVVDEVLCKQSGDLLSVSQVIGHDYEKAVQLRMALQEGIASNTPLYVCSICGVAVRLVSQKLKGRFFFRHDIEDGRCPARTAGKYDERQIQAMKYDGIRESVAHQRMKEIIASSLRADPEFSDVAVEQVWKGTVRGDRRKPDVSAMWRGVLPVAFEVQLSTTFLRVIAERRQFYLREGGLLLWVFKAFDAGDSRLTQDDIFYNNNRNAFIVSEETLRESLEQKALRLDCQWTEPVLSCGGQEWRAQHRRVSFSELTIQRERQRIYFFDAEHAESAVEAEVADHEVRETFHAYWLAKDFSDVGTWNQLRHDMKKRGIHLRFQPGDPDGPYYLLNTLYSAREGRPVGWGHAELINVAHHVFDRYKSHLWAMRLMLSAHSMGDLIRSQDHTGNWRNNKVRSYLNAWRAGDETYQPDRRFDQLVAFLFPEIADGLQSSPTG